MNSKAITKICSFKAFAGLILIFITVFISCKKQADAKLPAISIKSGGNYTSGDATLNKSEIITIGIIADKNEADLMTFRVYTSSGSNSLVLKNSYNLTESEKQHYEKDYKITTQNTYGYENWKFEITDRMGNINSVTLKFTIQ